MGTRLTAYAVACLLAIGALSLGSVASAQASGRRGPAVPVFRLGSRALTLGMRGTDVFHLQVLLAKRGYPVAADRLFGPQTRVAVERAQRAYGLGIDGVVGAATLAALRAGHAPTCPSVAGPGTAVTRWIPVVSCVLDILNQPRTPAYLGDILLVISGESGGNPFAINLWDINAKRGDPSRGLMQVIGRVFVKYHGAALPNDIFDPAANIYAGVSYAIATYGSIPNIPGVRSVAAGRHYVGYKRSYP